jgi:hypothetical protein
MATQRKILRIGLAATLLCIGLTVHSQGEIGSGPGFGPGGEMMMQMRGAVVCTHCSLEDAQHARPWDNGLYQLTYKEGQLVMQISWVSNGARWGRIAWPPRLHVRGAPSLLQQLSAEEQLFKEVELTGLLSTSRTLDLLTVRVRG